MRTAAELRAAALVTGTFADYRGDGATVPWQVAPPGTNVVLWAYKVYLDARWPEPFRLHDWLYTPYGALIAATRVESDDALIEEIARDSTLDAAIVGAAVRLGGEPYFGKSLTGYSSGSVPGGVPNMLLAPLFIGRSLSMAIKCVMLFQQSTKAGVSAPSIKYGGKIHLAGWSESVYFTLDDLASARVSMIGPRSAGLLPLCQTRAALLAATASLVGVRFYQGGAGKGSALAVSYTGRSTRETDVPNLCLLCKGGSSTSTNVRRWTLRGTPDTEIKDGEFSPLPSYSADIAAYFKSLQFFGFPGVEFTEGPHIVHSITPAAGNTAIVKLTIANPFDVNNLVVFTRLLKPDGKKIGARKFVSSLSPGGNSFTVEDWTEGPTTGGKADTRKLTVYPLDTTTIAVERVLTRRVGRPFEQYRGRR